VDLVAVPVAVVSIVASGRPARNNFIHMALKLPARFVDLSIVRQEERRCIIAHPLIGLLSGVDLWSLAKTNLRSTWSISSPNLEGDTRAA